MDLGSHEHGRDFPSFVGQGGESRKVRKVKVKVSIDQTIY